MSIYGTKLPERPSLSSASVEGRWVFTSACFQENFPASTRTLDTIKFFDLMMESHPFLDEQSVFGFRLKKFELFGKCVAVLVQRVGYSFNDTPGVIVHKEL